MDAHQAGAVIGGSSAGAMVLCAHYYNPHSHEIDPGLSLVPNAAVIPHYNNLKGRWLGALRDKLPEAVLIGLDEGIGLIDDGVEGEGDWTVYGGGQITLHDGDTIITFAPGESFNIAA